MNISPAGKNKPVYPTLAAAVACGAALTLSSCTCPSCEGAGLILRTEEGPVPWSRHMKEQYPNAKEILCRACDGTGRKHICEQRTAGVFISVIDEVK